MTGRGSKAFSMLTSALTAGLRLLRRRRNPLGHPESGRDGAVRRDEPATNRRRYAGDFTGVAEIRYRPKPDGAPDPGEIVWAWVPYEEDHRRGKDRPVLIVGRHSTQILALMLTSKDHSPASGGGVRGGDDYVDIGSGPWDRKGRPSEVKLDRVLQLNELDIRREGAVLDAAAFEIVAEGLRSRHGWS